MSRVDGVETEMYFISILKKKRETGTQNSNDDRESARTYLHQLILSFVRQQFAPHLEEVPSREREKERERERERERRRSAKAAVVEELLLLLDRWRFFTFPDLWPYVRWRWRRELLEHLCRSPA